MMQRWLSIFTLLILTVTTAMTQVTTILNLSRDTILIGDELDITLVVEVEDGYDIVSLGNPTDTIISAEKMTNIITQAAMSDDSTALDIASMIADIDIIDSGKWIDQNQNLLIDLDELQSFENRRDGNKTIYQNTWHLQIWDPQNIIVNIPSAIYKDDTQQYRSPLTTPISFYVAPPMTIVPTDSIPLSEQMRPIKSIFIEKVLLSDYFWLMILPAILLIGLAAYYISKRQQNKKEVEVEPAIIVPEHLVAIQELDKLKAQQLWQKGKIKEYQSQLTHIIRQYVEDRYLVQALESTTGETINQLKSKLESVDLTNDLQKILSIADLVKFAKATPSSDIHESFLQLAYQFVDNTSDKNKEIAYKQQLAERKENSRS